MKKTYIIPETLTVNLSMCNIIATSPGVSGDPTPDPVDPGTFDTKESKTVWDEEW